MLRPVVAAFGQLEHAAAANVGVAVRLRDFLAMPRDVVEDQPFAQGEIAQRDLVGAEASKNLVQQDRAGDGEVRAPRLEARHTQPLLEIQRDQVSADMADLLGGHPAVAQRCARREPAGGGRHRTEAEDRARGADDALEPAARNLVEVLADLAVDVPNELALVARLERIGFHEALGQANDAKLEAAPELNRRPGPSRDLDAPAPDVDDDRHVSRHADAVDGRQMDESGLFSAGNHAGTDTRLLRDSL
jgi:hypothetical protein